MDILYLSLLQHLTSEVPELNWIDEEKGQLEWGEESYPVQFPCCLIDINNIKWQSELKQQQTGDVTVRFRVAFDIYEDTHKGAPADQLQAGLDRLKLVNKIHARLHGFGGLILPISGHTGQYYDSHFKRLIRLQTASEKREDGLKVYNMDYLTNMKNVHPQPTLQELHNIAIKITGSFEDHT